MGDGPDRERLAALADDLNIRDDVKFLGHVSEERVFTEMARSDIFVFMSDKEGERLPNVVKEAMACRCFCVSSRTPGMEELIDQGTNGYLVDSGDVEEAGRIVRNYTNNNIDENKIKNKAVKKIKQSFSLKESAKSYKRAWKLVSN
jgi:glycosyltransferase involved in cell wall biosynthesis